MREIQLDGNEVLLVSIEEACEMTGVDGKTMLRLIETERFSTLLCNKKIFIGKGELELWLRRRYDGVSFRKLKH